MSAPRRKHSKPHIASIESVIDSIDLSTNTADDVNNSMSSPLGGIIIRDLDESAVVVTQPDTVLEEISNDALLPAADDDGNEHIFAHASVAFDAGIALPPPDHKLIPVLGNTRMLAVPKRIEAAQEDFLSSICTREELQQALASCEQLHIQRFLNDLSNPKLSSRNITALARRHNITPLELADLWRRHALAKGMLTIISGLPRLSEHLIEDSMSKMVYCQRCDGLGEVETKVIDVMRVCPACKGAGEIRIEGSSDARKMALEAAGIIGKKANTIVNPVIHTQSVESVIGELENLQLDTPHSTSNSRLRLTD